MNFKLTDSQREWLKMHKLKIGNLYSIPDYSFYIYERPSYASGEYVDLPRNKTTSNIFFKLYTISDDFLGGYFITDTARTLPKFIYLDRQDVECRTYGEYYILSLFCVVPMMIYNLLKK